MEDVNPVMDQDARQGLPLLNFRLPLLPTEADLEDLGQKLEAFCEQLPPRQQAALQALLLNAAGTRGEVQAADDPDEVTLSGRERSVPTGSHAENQSADTRFTAPRPATFYVMGVPLFEYKWW